VLAVVPCTVQNARATHHAGLGPQGLQTSDTTEEFGAGAKTLRATDVTHGRLHASEQWLPCC